MIVLTAIICVASAVASPTDHRSHADLWIWLENSEQKALVQDLGFGFVESQDGQWWRMHGETGSEVLLESLGIDYRVALSPSWLTDSHHSPEEMNEALEDLVRDHPESAEIIDIGTSVSGRPLIGVRLGRSSQPHRRMRILGAHHGDETSSAEVSLAAVERFLTDTAYDTFLDTNELWVVPHVNPDGIEALSRYNDNNVDLNRNYGFEWSESSFRSGDSPFSEPETQAIRALGSWVNFGLGLSVHSGAINLGWVWNYTEVRTSDEALLSQLADTYADDCTTDGFWTTNGADWYITNGDTTDWSYGRHGTLDYTLEVSRIKNPGVERMVAVLEEHAQAIPTILEWPWWVSGQVTDAESGVPIMATITIDALDQHLTSGHDGHFSRPVEDGIWTLHLTAPGYLPASVEVAADDTSFDVSLERAEVSPIRPSSRWISSDGTISLDGHADTLTLERPGYEAVTTTYRDGAWIADDETLAPGPWTVVVDELPVPNGLFVPEDSTRVTVDSVTHTETEILIEIPGLGRGARVWAMWGERRNPIAMPVLDETDEHLSLDASVLPIDTSPIDLLIWTRGLQLGIVDILSSDFETDPDPDPDTGHDTDTGQETEPDDAPEDSDPDSGQPDDPEPESDLDDPERDDQDIHIVNGGSKLETSACQSSPQHYRGWMWLVSLLALLLRRRSSCGPVY